MSDFKFEILEDYGSISFGKYGLSLKLIKWNDGQPKYDIRKWSEDGEQPFKGISLDKFSFIRLVDFLEKSNKQMSEKSVIHKGKVGNSDIVIYSIIGEISPSSNMPILLTYMDWGHGPKFDVRAWSDDYSKCGKGITLKKEDALRLVEIARKRILNKKKTTSTNLPAIDLDEELFL